MHLYDVAAMPVKRGAWGGGRGEEKGEKVVASLLGVRPVQRVSLIVRAYVCQL